MTCCIFHEFKEEQFGTFYCPSLTLTTAAELEQGFSFTHSAANRLQLSIYIFTFINLKAITVGQIHNPWWFRQSEHRAAAAVAAVKVAPPQNCS